ncbi:unnamed protein product [Clonostachys rhizophaga]|uniref:WKF domain-containing protein n=1 Tax=Clonostachys rhizophaga TaxID=160324 RepID=A0A9N9UVY0_9HYPO|nr:unnamed protein product [Clonostachys rhizophaga]
MSAAETQKVPAWKRLGLKLKQPAAAGTESPNGLSSIGAVGHPSSSLAQPSPKRKLAPPASHLNPIHGNKRPRRDESPKPKKVTFDDTPTKTVVPGNSDIRKTPAKKEAKPKKKSPAKQAQPAHDLKPALEYLRLWKTSRESWKFNKNHQSSLIKHIFDGPDSIPSSDVEAFYEYIKDLKGYVRTRLRETAMEVKTRDESDGYASFPEGTTDEDEKQAAYDSILAGILRRRNAGKRKFFSESQYVSESEDGEVIVCRLVKRMRAELVLDALSDSEESTTTDTSTSSKTVTAGDNSNTVTTNEDKQITINGAATRRRRKLRVNVDDTSSESESESDSESSSSSSSEDSDSDEEERPDEDETSSSSSSSSSEGDSDSESEEESDEED